MKAERYPSVRLSEIVTRTIGGGTPLRSIPSFWGGEIRWASVKDLSDEEIDLHETLESITPAGLAGSAANLVSIGTPIVCTRMAVGRCAAPTRSVAINQDLKALVTGQGVDPRFFLHSLKRLQPVLDSRSIGSTVKGIGLRDLLSVSIYLPSFHGQRRIAEILDTLDEAIRTTERLIAKLQQMKQGLLHDLLTRGIDENGELRDPERHPEQFKDSPLGLIPRGWEIRQGRAVCRRIEVGIVIRPTQYYVRAGIPILRSANVREDGVDLSDLEFMTEETHRTLSKSAVGPGDLVTVRTGYPGTTAVIPETLCTANCVDIIISRPGPDIRSSYFATWINSDHGKSQVLRVQGGLAQQHFNVGELKELLVALPSLGEQDRIGSVYDTNTDRLRDETRQLEKLRTLKRGLMDDLLTGRVRVDVSEEVAS
jgi:type I restriction enzyme, S subunit